MDKLRAMQYLLKVADTQSFSRAAKAFGVPASRFRAALPTWKRNWAWCCCTVRHARCDSPKSVRST